MKYFLGIEVALQEREFTSQLKYVMDLLKETGKTAYKPTSTPTDPSLKMGSAQEDALVPKEMYLRLVGSLIYLSHTRPNIDCEVSFISQLMYSPREVHLQSTY